MTFEFDFLNALQLLHTPWMDQAMKFVTRLGNGGMFWIAFGAALCIPKNTRKAGICVLLALALEYYLCSFLKTAFHRPRPFEVNTAVSVVIGGAGGYSFPSGHTASSFAAAFALLFAKEKRLFYPALGLAALIAFSRMYFYVHYPTDILGGIVLGAFVAGIACSAVYSGLRFAGKPC